MKTARLGVNVDHVATLRMTRGEDYPCLQRAVEMCLNAGAEQITMHLREDRRHVQESDIKRISTFLEKREALFNFEIACDPFMLELSRNIHLDQICLVPENRQEMTTEGGLELRDPLVFKKIEKSLRLCRDREKDVLISLFLESDLEILRYATHLDIDAVEIHTGHYAKDVLEGRSFTKSLNDLLVAGKFLKEHQILPHAGHGLTDESLVLLAKENIFEEFNIGHWIISQALFDGLPKTVSSLKNILKR